MNDNTNIYENVDKQYIDNLCKNSNLKNLILLSSQSNINIFNKKNKKWSLKSQDKIFSVFCLSVEKERNKNVFFITS